MKSGNVDIKYFMETITRDLIAHMREEGYLDRVVSTKLYKDGKLDYDRNQQIKDYEGTTTEQEDLYDADIETLSIQILQMVHYGNILYKDSNGRNIRSNHIIKE